MIAAVPDLELRLIVARHEEEIKSLQNDLTLLRSTNTAALGRIEQRIDDIFKLLVGLLGSFVLSLTVAIITFLLHR